MKTVCNLWHRVKSITIEDIEEYWDLFLAKIDTNTLTIKEFLIIFGAGCIFWEILYLFFQWICG